MDYIRQELQLQRQLLAALLLGGAVEGTVPRTDEKSVLLKKMAAQDYTVSLGDGQSRVAYRVPQIRVEEDENERRGAGRKIQETLQLMERREMRTASDKRQPAGQHRRQWAPNEPQVYSVIEFFEADGEKAMRPADVSLAFQRDARRYDGGFSLY